MTDLDDRELEVLLELLGRQGFLIHQLDPNHHRPTVLAATRNLGEAEDVIVLLDRGHAAAWRCPTGPGIDPLAPAEVLWSYAACAVWTMRAALALPLPGHPDAPATLTTAPAGLGLPADARMPARVRKRGW
jgi:hypothetical protein